MRTISPSASPIKVPSTMPSVILSTIVISGTYMYELKTSKSDDKEFLADETERKLMVDVGDEIRTLNKGRTLASAVTIEMTIETFHQWRSLQTNNSTLYNDKFAPYCKHLKVTDESTSECNTVEAKFNFTILGSPNTSKFQAGTRVLNTIKTNMGSIDKRNMSVYFLGGKIDGLGITGESKDQPQQPEVSKTSKNIPQVETKSVKVVGICVTSVAVILIAVSVFVLSRKKQNYDAVIKEPILDDDSSMSETPFDAGFHPYGVPSDNGTDQTSITSNNLRQPAAYDDGEDSSIFTNRSTSYEYHNDELHKPQQNDFRIQAHRTSRSYLIPDTITI